MNKIPIKVIKRKDVEATASAKIQIARETMQNGSVNKDKKERRLRLAIVKTISNWIPERKKNNRLEEIAAIRKFFGGEKLLSKI